MLLLVSLMKKKKKDKEASQDSNDSHPLQSISKTTSTQSAHNSTNKSKLPTASKVVSEDTHKSTHSAHAQTRFVPHRYLLRRPRALQIEYHGELVKVGDEGKVDVNDIESHQISHTTTHASSSTDNNDDDDDDDNDDEEESSDRHEHQHERSTDNIIKQRERLELFVDLIWVGVVSNLSEHFYNQTFEQGNIYGSSVSAFIITFGAAWQIWSRLQLFLNSYFLDDVFQRFLIMWVLCLGVAWGNNAPYIFDNDNNHGSLIAIYLVAMNSLVWCEILYSFWLPWLRKYLLIGAIVTLPTSSLWITAISFEDDVRIPLLWAAIIYDKVSIIILQSPLVDRFLGDGVRKGIDHVHIRSRYETFFTIALGEGIILLIRGSPLGVGITEGLSRGVMVVVMYYFIHSTYFAGDQSKWSVHPIHLAWWRRSLWTFLHVVLFGSLILLSSGLSYLVVYSSPEISPDDPTGGDGSYADYITFQTAIVTSCACLSLFLLQTLLMALLSKPEDPPNTLVINNRYIRLAPRAIAVPLLATIWLVGFEDSSTAIGVMLLIVWIIFSWEFYTSMETGWKVVEPKQRTS